MESEQSEQPPESARGKSQSNAESVAGSQSPGNAGSGQFSEEIKKTRWLVEHREEYSHKLLKNIKERLPQLEKLLAQTKDHWGMEDGVYRFYHQSFKVYYLQSSTGKICPALQGLLPDQPLNDWFAQIVKEGIGHQFQMSHNEDWLRHTRPIVETLFHAHYFLKMVVKYGRELDAPPGAMPSGWAAVLYLFDLR